MKRYIDAIILILLLGFTAAMSYDTLREYRDSRPEGVSSKGTKFPITGMEWNRSRLTVVLLLNTRCHFCTASAPFYKRLEAIAKKKAIPIVAYFPQSTEGISYLRNLEVPISEVKQAPLEDFSSGTPTLLFVDSHGVVRELWAGQLSSDAENQVLGKM